MSKKGIFFLCIILPGVAISSSIYAAPGQPDTTFIQPLRPDSLRVTIDAGGSD